MPHFLIMGSVAGSALGWGWGQEPSWRHKVTTPPTHQLRGKAWTREAGAWYWAGGVCCQIVRLETIVVEPREMTATAIRPNTARCW